MKLLVVLNFTAIITAAQGAVAIADLTRPDIGASFGFALTPHSYLDDHFT